MNNYQIFISYRRDGGDALAGRLADRFNALGYKVFYDVESLRSGTFNTQILDALAQCNDVLLVLPPNALDRCVNADDWVRQELAFALEHGKNIIPIMMRGFEFPKLLPTDIDKIRYMEGVTASSEYFDAVIEHIEKLLKATASEQFNYHLESQEYYKIKLPWNNLYKRRKVGTVGYGECAAYITKQLLINNGERFGDTELAQFFKKNPLEDWYIHHEKQLLLINRKIKALQNYYTDNKQNYYFYINAILYTIGLYSTIDIHTKSVFEKEQLRLLAFCMDWPVDNVLDFLVLFYKNAYSDFIELLPLAFDIWPNNVGLNLEYKKQFDQYAILLFDYMLDCAMLYIETYKKNANAVRVQILSYYKHLKKNKLYLPKEMQEKIYRYL